MTLLLAIGIGSRIASSRQASAAVTYFWVDPQEQMVVVLMLQAPDMRLAYRYLLPRLVYGALTGTLWRPRRRRWRDGRRRSQLE